MKSNIKNLLINSLFELLKYKNIDNITITELVKNAKISRVSFYNNFNNIIDILNYEFDIIINDLNKLVILNNLRKHDNIDLISEILFYVEKNRDIFLVIKNNFFFEFKEKLDFKLFNNNMNYYVLSGSVINIVLYYLENNYKIEEILKKIDNFN